MNTNNHEDREHAKLAPSSAHIWTQCPGSVYLSSQVPKPEDTVYAKKGRETHELIERLLTAEGEEEFNEIVEATEDKDSLYYALKFVEYVSALRNKLQPYIFNVEARVKVNKHIWGTCDVGMVYQVGDGAIAGVVIDYKDGKGVKVEVEENEQVILYGLGYQEKIGQKFEYLTTVIYQPRTAEEGESPASVHRYTRKELEYWSRKLKRAGTTSLKMLNGEKPPKYKAGPHCRFCDAIGACTTHLDYVNKDALIELEKAAGLPAADQLSDDQVLAIIKNRSIIETFLKSVVEYAKVRAIQNRPIKGTKLVSGRTQRKWINDQELVADRLKSLGIEDPYNKTLIGITKTEELIGKGKLDSVTELTQPQVTIALESDKRPAIDVHASSKAVDMLDDLPEQN